MTDRDAQIIEFELMAYVDQQLNAEQRMEVEEYLSRHPGLAAQVMAEMRIADALRIAGGRCSSAATERILYAVGRLENALGRQKRLRLMRRSATFAAVAGIGWVSHGMLPGTTSAVAASSIIDDALMAHRTALLRAGMHSQTGATTKLDARKLGLAAHVQLPALPDGWRITDVQLFPSGDGPAVQVTFDPAGPSRMLSLVAARTWEAVPTAPTVVVRGSERVAYWRRGQTAFAVTGGVDQTIRAAAVDLADNPPL